MRRRKKALGGMGPGDVLLAAAGNAAEREAVADTFDPATAVRFRQMLLARYDPMHRAADGVTSGALPTGIMAQKEPTLDESTVARIVGAAVGTAVDLGASPMQVAEIATEGVWAVLRFPEYTAMTGREEDAE